MKFKKQARSEFGRAWVPAGQGAAGGGRSGAAASPATGQAVASFYGSLVKTSGSGWVSGGTLADTPAGATTDDTECSGEAAAGPPAAAVVVAAAVTGAGAGGRVHHAGLGSAASRADVEAEARQLQAYAQPAGPLQRGEQAAADQQQQQQQQQQQAQQQHAEQQQRRARVAAGSTIARSNVGYQLLRKAGWREGSGLGAQEQGATEPVGASQQKGNLGLGFPVKQAHQGKQAQQAQQQGAAAPGQQQQQQQQQPKRPLPEDPLDKEDVETKVKRVGQVMQAEADAKAGKAIERYMRLAFRDATGEATSDSNPLLRRNHKLSATNPLL